MNWKSLLIVLAALALVAGCAAPTPGPAAPAPGAPAPSAPSAPAPGEEGGAMMEGVSISSVSAPGEVLIGKPIAVSWKVDGKGAVETAVAYSTKSKADVTDVAMTTYGSKAPRVALSGTAPGDFSASFTVDEPIKIYLRVYATAGGKTVWSDEKVVSIVTKLSASSSADDSADDGSMSS